MMVDCGRRLSVTVVTMALVIVLQTLVAGASVADDRWHEVRVKRRARHVHLNVDNLHQAEGEMPDDSTVLSYDRVYVGEPAGQGEGESEGGHYEGLMEHLTLNGDSLLEPDGLAGRTGSRIDMAAHIHPRTGHRPSDGGTILLQNSLTFESQAAYFIVKLKLYTTFSISLRLRTTQTDGLLVYSGGGSGGDFLVLELVAGHVHYVYDTGTGTRYLSLDRPGDPRLNDNAWHTLSLHRPNILSHVLRVDDVSVEDELAEGSRALHYDMDDSIYVGGVEKQMYHALPPASRARRGFQGCMASLDLNGEPISLSNHRVHVPAEHKSAVKDSCRGPERVCTNETCVNGGVCQQDWYGVTCDCDMTSFTGPTCADEGTAYTFGPRGGLISYVIPRDKRPNTKIDMFALGLMTSQTNAVLFRIESGNSKDYIEMEIIDGSVLVVYNMGALDHPIGELFERVNDSRYHVIRFQRNGQNATIQVDQHAVQMKNPKDLDQLFPIGQPTGDQLNIFNNQAEIQIGGKRDAGGRVLRPFRGVMAGLTFNGLRLMEMAASGDPSISITGDVELHIGSFLTSGLKPTTKPSAGKDGAMQATTRSKTSQEGATDSLIIAKGDCDQGQGDECRRAPQASDALITASTKYRRTTTTRPTTSTTTTPGQRESESSGSEPCLHDCDLDFGHDDDEDGYTGDKEETDKNIHIDPNIDTNHNFPQSIGDIDNDVIVEGGEDGETGHNSHHSDTDKQPPANHLTSNSDVTPPPTVAAPLTTPTTRTPILAVTPSRVSHVQVGAAGSGGGLTGGNYSLARNVALIGGVGAGIILLVLLIVYAVYKFRARDEGTYKIDESKQYTYSTCNLHPPPSPTIPGPPPTRSVNGNGQQQPPKSKRRDIKEWYV